MADPKQREVVVAAGEEAFAALAHVLEEQPDRVHHAEYGQQWVSRDVYVHMASWQSWVTESLLKSLETGEPIDPYADEAEMEEINAAWYRDGQALSLDEARGQCDATRRRMLAVFGALSDEQWAKWFDHYSAEVDGSHYRGHLEYIRASGSSSE